jgi:NitT/TauT family transport system permease protein
MSAAIIAERAQASTSPVDVSVLAARIALGVVLLTAWEWAGRTFGHSWTSLPSLIGERLLVWGTTTLWRNIGVTLAEIGIGLAIGATAGIALGLLLGRTRVTSVVVRPLIIALYSVPIVTLAPLLILWFGLELAPKIALVATSALFLLFFNTFSGVQAIDRDLLQSLKLMGARGGEEFRMIALPGSMPWIVSGLKIAVPYAFAAAVTGELLAAREGLGSLLSAAAAQFDMTGLYAALFVLMVLGILANLAMTWLEKWLLRWRQED